MEQCCQPAHEYSKEMAGWPFPDHRRCQNIVQSEKDIQYNSLHATHTLVCITFVEYVEKYFSPCVSQKHFDEIYRE